MECSPTSRFAEIIGHVRRFKAGRQRITVFAGLAQVGIVALTGLLVALMCSWLFRYVPAGRSVFLALWGLVGGIVLVKRVLPALLVAPRDEQVALSLERLHPELSGHLITAVQLGGEARRLAVGQLYSLDLVDSVVGQTADVLGRLSMQEDLDRQTLRRNGAVLAVESVLLAIAFIVSPGHFKNSLGLLLHAPSATGAEEGGDALAQAAKIAIGDISIKYYFPVYTRRAPESLTGASGDLSALKGTRAEISARCSRPVTQASLVMNGQAQSQAVPLRVENHDRLSGELSLMEPGTYQFQVKDEQGRVWLDPTVHAIQPEPDDVPKVELLWPQGDMQVSERDTLPLRYQATDDFGLSALRLVIEQKGKRQQKDVPGLREGGAQVNGKYPWDLSELKLEAESEITFYIEALDNDSVSGPKRGVSAAHRLKVFSARQRHQEILAQQEELLRDLLHLLSALLLKRVDGAQAGSRDYLLMAYEEIADRLGKAIERTDAILKAMKEDKLANYSIYFGLNKIKEDLIGIADHRRDEIRTVMGSHPLKVISKEILSQLAVFHAEHVQRVEDDVILLNSLIEKQRLDEAMAEAEKLSKSADALSNLMQELQKKGDKETADKLLQELEKLEAMMARIAEQLARMGKDIPDEFMNLDALKDLGIARVEDVIQKVRDALAKGDYKTAMALMQDLLKAMAGFAGSLSNSSKQYAALNYSQMLADIQQFEQRLKELMTSQQDVLDDTKKMKKTLSDRTRAEMDKRFKDFFAKQLERVRAMQGGLKAMKSDIANDPEGRDLAKRQAAYESLRQQRDDLFRGLAFDRDGKDLARIMEQQTDLDQKIEAEENYLEGRPGSQRLFQILKRVPDVEGQLETLGKMLEGWDVQESLNLARRMLPTIQFWQTVLDRQGRGAGSASMKALEGKVGARVKEEAETGKAILDDLESLKSAVSDMQRQSMLPGEDKAVGDLQRRQGGARQSTEKLREDLGKFTQKTPLFGPGCGDHVQQAGESMRGAETELGERNPAAGVTYEREALYELSQAQQRLQEGKDRIAKGMMGTGMPMPMWAGNPERGTREGFMGSMLREIPLPTPEDFRAPKEFRQDILDAMRAPSPRGFEEQNKNYYRRLVE